MSRGYIWLDDKEMKVYRKLRRLREKQKREMDLGDDRSKVFSMNVDEDGVIFLNVYERDNNKKWICYGFKLSRADIIALVSDLKPRR